jgi:hypothetical protein
VTTIGYREWAIVTSKTMSGRAYLAHVDPDEKQKRPPPELCGVLLPPSWNGPPWQPVITTAQCGRLTNWPKHLADLGYEPRDPFEEIRLGRAHLHEFRPLPPDECSCGLWVYREPYKPKKKRKLWTSGHTCDCKDCAGATRVPGAVLLAGRIFPHEHGWRAQHGMVIVLVHSDPDRLRSVLRSDYHHIPIVKTWRAAQPFIDRWKGGE